MTFTSSYAYRFRFSFTYGEAGRLAVGAWGGWTNPVKPTSFPVWPRPPKGSRPFLFS